MPEIIPNWHPAVVHFPIALTVTATLILLAARLRPADATLAACARLLLALAALAAMLAAGFGWQAFLTVEHDAAGHRVMLQHRNWAMACTVALVLLALWDDLRRRAGKGGSHSFLLPALLLVSGGFGVTGWLGGEMVYRHGVGVSPALFASPAAAVDVPLPDTAVAPAPADVQGEHVHKDGKRHHH